MAESAADVPGPVGGGGVALFDDARPPAVVEGETGPGPVVIPSSGVSANRLAAVVAPLAGLVTMAGLWVVSPVLAMWVGAGTAAAGGLGWVGWRAWRRRDPKRRGRRSFSLRWGRTSRSVGRPGGGVLKRALGKLGGGGRSGSGGGGRSGGAGRGSGAGRGGALKRAFGKLTGRGAGRGSGSGGGRSGGGGRSAGGLRRAFRTLTGRSPGRGGSPATRAARRADRAGRRAVAGLRSTLRGLTGGSPATRAARRVGAGLRTGIRRAVNPAGRAGRAIRAGTYRFGRRAVRPARWVARAVSRPARRLGRRLGATRLGRRVWGATRRTGTFLGATRVGRGVARWWRALTTAIRARRARRTGGTGEPEDGEPEPAPPAGVRPDLAPVFQAPTVRPSPPPMPVFQPAVVPAPNGAGTRRGEVTGMDTITTSYAAMIDGSTPETLSRTLGEAADAARRDAAALQERADELRREAAGLDEMPGMRVAAEDFLREAAQIEQDIEKRLGMAAAYDDRAEQALADVAS